jgi:KDEL-tailed cysteine endopeptidase
MGCDGGWYYKAYNYLKDYNLSEERFYDY